MKTSTATETAKSSFFEMTDFDIPIAYDFMPGVQMHFYMRLQMSEEAALANQSFLGLSEQERKDKDHDNNVNLLAMLSTRMPEGVPTFESDGSIQESITKFFAGENPMKRKLAIDVLNRYFKRAQPKEYL